MAGFLAKSSLISALKDGGSASHPRKTKKKSAPPKGSDQFFTLMTSQCEVTAAMRLLKASSSEEDVKRVTFGLDRPNVSPSDVVASVPCSPSMLAVARSVFRPGKIYRFKLNRTATLTASGAGILLVATGVTISGFIESSAIQALFDECRLVRTRIQYGFLVQTSQGAGMPTSSTFCSSFDPSNISTAPTFSVASQIPGAKYTMTSTTIPFRNSFDVRGGRVWSLTSASGSGTDPIGGMAGTWYHAISPVASANQVVANYLLEAEFEFRNCL
jgi:hypothetical protein